MLKKNISQVLMILVVFSALEIWSYLGYLNPVVNAIVFVLLVSLALILSFYRLELGLLMIAGELFIGSFGYLFAWPFTYHLSLRIALWGVVLLVFCFNFLKQLIKSGRAASYYQAIKNFSPLKYFILLFFFIFLALVNGLLRGHNLSIVFSDFNAWLYWLLLFPAIIIYNSENQESRKRIQILFFAAAIWLSLKTLGLLFIFTHNLAIAPEIYTWLRQTLVGEMTATLGGWPRVFIQGQIYVGLAFFGILLNDLFSKKENNICFGLKTFLLSLFFSTLLISFSRSFWVAFCLTLILALIYIIYKLGFKKSWFLIFITGASLVGGFLLTYGAATIPISRPGKFNADFISRVSNQGEAALSSRWSLLPVLINEISLNPFLGQGYGATITYTSFDPRVLKNNPDGRYTTYAFEWGYLDLWLKLGSLGLGIYFLLLWMLWRQSFKVWPALSFGLIFLLITNIFTPYLNHPLGIGLLVLSSCLIAKDGVY